ncbi:SH3 domain protein [Metarhizium album ARSEF 1941]|uniref:SH3 domain protein n=1 Tax=Metarhizium album (strain ARSEF 1941) TaxID=1081103 RepID=A0A0B2WRV1_METAS|nr:SH3 domain protein [Metarhizium album ARSEF 1941]KHN95710.1 SH3 domain protein [Metarhizium album ARSEF 1941]
MDDLFRNPFGDDNRNKNEKSNAQRDTGGGNGPTLIRTIYKTMAPTFEGPIAGYSTITEDSHPAPTRASSPANKPDPKPTPSTTLEPKPKEKASLPSVIYKPVSTGSADETELIQASGIPTPTPTIDPGVQLTSTSTSTPTPTPTLNFASSTPPTATTSAAVATGGDSGTSAAAKAGIAFGVLGGVFLVGLAAFFLFNRRRRQAAERGGGHEEKSYAKTNANTLDAMTVRSDPHAPRISLRPVTQFLPNWGLDKRTSKNAGMAWHPSAAVGAHSQNNAMWERPSTSQSTHPANPFGNQAERVPEPSIYEHGAVSRSDPLTANGPAIAGGAATGAGVVGLTRKASMRDKTQRNIDLTLPPKLGSMPPSPAGTEFSMTSVAPGAPMPPSSGAEAIAAAGGPSNSNVHRVQLDFKPSLDDEMELRAGDLVRLLHEYDDGWALVIRLDRSQQGVVPRTCLSTRPVKPRSPQGQQRLGPPINPSGQHPRGPNQPQGPGQRPMTPHGRPMTPQARPMTPQARPMTPQGSRPMTPQGTTPQARPRVGQGAPGIPSPRPMSPAGLPPSPGPRHGSSASPGGMNRATGPVGPRPAQSPPPGPPNGPPTRPIGRKPVPGQAY